MDQGRSTATGSQRFPARVHHFPSGQRRKVPLRISLGGSGASGYRQGKISPSDDGRAGLPFPRFQALGFRELVGVGLPGQWTGRFAPCRARVPLCVVLIHDGADRGGAASALRAAAEAAVDLGRRAGAVRAGVEAGTHLAVREDIARANDHGDTQSGYASRPFNPANWADAACTGNYGLYRRGRGGRGGRLPEAVAADQGAVRRTLPSLRDNGEGFMCLAGAGGPPVNGFGDEGPLGLWAGAAWDGRCGWSGAWPDARVRRMSRGRLLPSGPGSGGPPDRLHGARRARCDLVGCAGAVRVRRIGEHCGNTYLDVAPG